MCVSIALAKVNWVLDFDCHLPISFFPSQTAAAAAATSFFFIFFIFLSVLSLDCGGLSGVGV